MEQVELTYEERKFRRMWRDAVGAVQIAHMTATAQDGTICVMVVKSALRSRGYRSGYEATPKYWQFLWKDGKAAYARTLNSPEKYAELLAAAKKAGWAYTPALVS